MRHAPITPELFIENRTRLAKLLPPRAIAVLNANDILPTNADGTHAFVQNNDLFHLTGINQEETLLILFPDAPDEKHRAILFLRESNDNIARWEGKKHTKETARAASGIQEVHWLDSFEPLFRLLMKQAGHVFLNTNEHARAADLVETRDLRFIRETQRNYPLHDYRRIAPLMEQLRAIKTDTEIALILKACEITERGFRRLLPFVKPGVHEFEIEAELIHEYLRHRSDGFAYAPIIASGENACVLHYVTNHAPCQDGDLLLLDCAANYAGYNSDLTRTIPVNGRYTPRQRAVYEAVLRVKDEATKMLRPGVLIADYQKEVGKLMESELIGLRLLDRTEVDAQDEDKPLYKKYFMHGTSHHIGLDVHDVGDTTKPITPGMVFTVEPGIYIPEESIGIRLENNIVIGKDTNIDLMASIPVDPDEIETLMAG